MPSGKTVLRGTGAAAGFAFLRQRFGSQGRRTNPDRRRGPAGLRLGLRAPARARRRPPTEARGGGGACGAVRVRGPAAGLEGREAGGGWAALARAGVRLPAPPARPPGPGWPPPPRPAPSLARRPDGTDRGWFELVRLHDDTRGAISSGAAARRALSVPSASAAASPLPVPPRAGSPPREGARRRAGGRAGADGAVGGPVRSAASPWGRPEAPLRCQDSAAAAATAAREGPSSAGLLL
ncbi:transcription initiation factor TFIID subunit 4-like [Phyllostomus discolor]|uniref:Transcription initiation factor TFIID subunit 4-like n=1 Tax=Phyllostomus discolor TaxID=89673 RepID=A0A7E6DYD0_9CHIR|nr:transcription initiation factor TFIID subunit 4-like [Phyllostomus discolor]